MNYKTGKTFAFSEEYGRLRTLRVDASCEREPLREEFLQCIWYDQLVRGDDLCADDGCRVRVISPGWWNRGEGPDFRNARLEIDGHLLVGDVEIHLTASGWRAHGHHHDERYNDVVLAADLDETPPKQPLMKANGAPVRTLRLAAFLDQPIREMVDRLVLDHEPGDITIPRGKCSTLIESRGAGLVSHLLRVAGDWRILNKARLLRDTIERKGIDQALYEGFLSACGFARYKHHFRFIAQQLPYERLQQLAQYDGLLPEAALLQIAGLLPDSLPDGAVGFTHHARLRGLINTHAPGLRHLALPWKRGGVRPNNYPERRLAGAARFLARTARHGIADALDKVWAYDAKPVKQRQAFEALFPRPMGFWADHCTWTGKKSATPSAMLGPARVRAIIGNVFIPAALAVARCHPAKPQLEQQAFDLFSALPKEEANHVLRTMIPRLFAEQQPRRLRFREQQGLMQMYQDWCEANPACHNCRVIHYLAEMDAM